MKMEASGFSIYTRVNGRLLIDNFRNIFVFIHFTVNAFTGSGGDWGDEPNHFNPKELDAYIIWATTERCGEKDDPYTTTAQKHHDGLPL